MPIDYEDCIRARANWSIWRHVFEFEGIPSENPILEDEALWRSFLSEYNVNRTVRAGQRDQLRLELLRLFDEIQDGSSLDSLNIALKEHYGTHTPPRTIISLLSKVASFLISSNFIAWDRYTRRGISQIEHEILTFNYTTYQQYIDDVMNNFGDDYKDQISVICQQHGNFNLQPQHLDAFYLRVFDSYLMRIGGRPGYQI